MCIFKRHLKVRREPLLHSQKQYWFGGAMAHLAKAPYHKSGDPGLSPTQHYSQILPYLSPTRFLSLS